MLLALGPFAFIGIVMVITLVPFAFWIVALLDVARAPEAAFGPPWDNSKNAWLVGLAVAFVVPAGVIVGAILWWAQGRRPLRSGQPVPRPFWSPRPSAPYPYVPPGQPPAQQMPYEQPPQQP